MELSHAQGVATFRLTLVGALASVAAGIIGLRGYSTGLTEAGEFVNLSSIVRPLKRASWVFVLAGIAALTSAGIQSWALWG
jgi:hypothetical protein